MRREWFGCLSYQSYSGRYWQFNQDAFDILHRLKIPLTLPKLRKELFADEMIISDQELQEFFDLYERQGLISRRNESSEVLVMYENRTIAKTNCLIAPSSVTLYITDFCPKCCRHCATDAHPGVKTQEELTEDNWIGIIQQMREAGVLTLIISGGEPLAAPYTQRILEAADKLQFGLTLLTDFDEVDKQQVEGLKSLRHLISIQTSLDGSNADTHDFLRGEGSFPKTLRRLQIFRDAELSFTVAIALHKRNIGELDRIVELANQFGASSIYLNAVAPYGRAKKTMQGLFLDDEDLKLMAQKCLRLVDTGIVKMRNPFWKSEMYHLGDEGYNPLSGTLNAMSIGIYNFAISSNGDCYLDAKQRAEGLLKLGNILETDLLTMWNDPRLDKIRSLYSSESYAFDHQIKIEEALNSDR